MLFSILLHIVSYDLWFYITHYFLHTEYLYNKIHHIHHRVSYSNLKWYNTSDGHLLEHIIQGAGLFIPCLFYLDMKSFCMSVLIIHIRGYLRHDDRASWLCGNHHILHHKYNKYNYSEYYIDYLFGSLSPHKI
jgi:sterol desaturase/sphingolipid hydroxylase (fatty acid hydroxylase superfamily)